jgi:tetrachlorobenzoquinone reductase
VAGSRLVSIELSSSEGLRVLVRSMTLLAADTIAVEFVSSNGSLLPPFEAGAHIDIVLSSELRRSYSLCNKPGERERYVVAVRKASPSRGASVYIHDRLRVGQRLEISKPRNNFPLVPLARQSVFIAGGIGITPIWAMIQLLEERRAPWKLYYAACTKEHAAFLGELQSLSAPSPKRIDIRFDHEPGVPMLDLGAIIADHAGDGVHFYACGPVPMLDAFETATKSIHRDNWHLERFSAGLIEKSQASFPEYEVVLAKSDRRLKIKPGKSLLDTLLDAGVDIEFSCMEGICGSCKVKVLEGLPDHCDSVLSDRERSRNDTMLVCCSGSRSEQLVLDL